ncbi:MAG: ABC transporter substrate-binding protein [Alphaproteobacteria bacterium]|nr:ABC transporter substrate-binding protein [Alphaproteobacteria bacterium]
MKPSFLKRMAMASAGAAVLALVASPVLADKASDSLVWATDREVNVPLPYFENVREMVIMSRLVWDTLLYRDPKTFEYKPQLATDYKWVDNVTIEMNLQKGVKFHNGAPFSADDVVATFNHISSPDSGVLSKRNVSWIKNAEKLGDYKVRINLVKPFPAALEFLSGPLAILPKDIWGKAKTDAKGKKDWGTIPPIGTGPYKMSKVVTGERIEMELNKNYWNGPKGKPSIGKVVFRTVPDPEVQVAELLTGSLDWIWDVPKDKAEDLDKTGQLTVKNVPTMRVSYITMDHAGRAGKENNPWTKLKVRQAVAHAIDREAIAKNLVGGASTVIHSACYPTQVGCTQDVPQYKYDPAKAKKLLAEAGYPNGFKSDIYAYRQRDYTEAVMGYLAKVGIKTNLKYMQYKALRGIVWDGKAPFHHMTWGSSSMNDVSAITSHFFKHTRDDYCRDADVKK